MTKTRMRTIGREQAHAEQYFLQYSSSRCSQLYPREAHEAQRHEADDDECDAESLQPVRDVLNT